VFSIRETFIDRQPVRRLTNCFTSCPARLKLLAAHCIGRGTNTQMILGG